VRHSDGEDPLYTSGAVVLPHGDGTARWHEGVAVVELRDLRGLGEAAEVAGVLGHSSRVDDPEGFDAIEVGGLLAVADR
jgi:hypothetical protein